MTSTSKAARDDPERFDPTQSPGTLVAAEHIARYRVAAGLADGRRVLDAGCGTGYGTQILTQAGAQSVHGIDIDDDATSATRALTDGAAEIVRGDIHELPYEDASFDLVVCFEVIEHVERRREVLRELRRVLADEGILVISTPNRDVYPAGNPHHVYEYESAEFEQELRNVFATVACYGQWSRLASVIGETPIDAVVSEDVLVEAVAGERPMGETYVVALATDGPVLPGVHQVVALAEGFEVRWWNEQVQNRARTLAREARAHAEDRERIAELNRRLLATAAEGAELVDLRRRFHEVEGSYRLLLEEFEQLRSELEEHESEMETIEAVYASLSWRITKPLRAFKRGLRRSAS